MAVPAITAPTGRWNAALHPHDRAGRWQGKPGHRLRDAVGEFAAPSGEWKSTLDRHLIDYNHGIPGKYPPRSLSKTSETEHVQRIFRGSKHVDYSETPFFDELERLQGTPKPGRMNAALHAQKRDDLFARQPLEDIPTSGIVLTQPNVNRPAVLRLKPTVMADPAGHPAYAVRHKGKVYVMDGHHRLAAARLSGAKTYPARMLDLDKRAGHGAALSAALHRVELRARVAL